MVWQITLCKPSINQLVALNQLFHYEVVASSKHFIIHGQSIYLVRMVIIEVVLWVVLRKSDTAASV